MATYDGVLLTLYLSEKQKGSMLGSGDVANRFCSKFTFTSDKSYAGTYSLCLYSGGVYEVLYGCNAGDKTISVYAYPPKSGLVYMYVYDPIAGERVATADPATGSGAWEQISASFTAESKIYVVRLINPVSSTDNVSDMRAYFDNLE